MVPKMGTAEAVGLKEKFRISLIWVIVTISLIPSKTLIVFSGPECRVYRLGSLAVRESSPEVK
jgi:hypothetical protein